MSLAQELEILGADSNRDEEQLITLNLRGTLITVNSRCADSFPGSRLWRALRRQEPQPMRDEQGRSFFNRNPTLFHEVLDVAVNEKDEPLHDEVATPIGIELPIGASTALKENESQRNE